MFVINYGLEYVTNLDIAYISYSTHILFDYKLVLVIFILGSKRSLVFYTLFELSIFFYYKKWKNQKVFIKDKVMKIENAEMRVTKWESLK